ncbi:MAG: prepilin-type N-terminal cleavage/methylation domain-containing protein [Zoogloeaceae bacterium]|jgi:prepilin-type N-terminal cleavage/methylation domain-containing protein|nr:prepilin-type N-terminal cleavage/methylation domain-containing protein [Zoogloeaceae bacterium]
MHLPLQRHGCAHPVQKGFTLLEIAIVLVIIGLLLGGVLKGQELIVQARIKNIIGDLNGLSAAIYTYQDRHRALPGDERNAAVSARWNGVTGGDGNGVICGAYNGAAGGAACNGEIESTLIWQHLRQTGLITGAAGRDIPTNAAGGLIGIQSGAFGFAGHVLCASNLPAKIAAAIDAQLDDGNPRAGSVRGTQQSAPNPAASASQPADTAYQDDGSQIYLVCKQI